MDLTSPQIFITGLGAVSPAGWGIKPLWNALTAGTPLPVQSISGPGRPHPLAFRPVPAPALRPAFLSHPRMRRASAVTHYAVGAAMEALGGFPLPSGREGLGIVVCLQAGPVQYATRLFQEILDNPATASPMLFPETVFAAPASHLATLAGNPPLAYTLLGDSSCFLQGLAIGVDWLLQGRVRTALVVGAEEMNWVLAEGARQFKRQAICGPGAAAICLGCSDAGGIGAELALITDPHAYTASRNFTQAARAMRQQLPPGSKDELLCDGLGGPPAPCGAEEAAWADWPGARLSPRKVLGEGLVAAAGWQCVAAVHGVAIGRFSAANVGLVGCTQQAIGARFIPARGPTSPPGQART